MNYKNVSTKLVIHIVSLMLLNFLFPVGFSWNYLISKQLHSLRWKIAKDSGAIERLSTDHQYEVADRNFYPASILIESIGRSFRFKTLKDSSNNINIELREMISLLSYISRNLKKLEQGKISSKYDYEEIFNDLSNIEKWPSGSIALSEAGPPPIR